MKRKGAFSDRMFRTVSRLEFNVYSAFQILYLLKKSPIVFTAKEIILEKKSLCIMFLITWRDVFNHQ